MELPKRQTHQSMAQTRIQQQIHVNMRIHFRQSQRQSDGETTVFSTKTVETIEQPHTQKSFLN